MTQQQLKQKEQEPKKPGRFDQLIKSFSQPKVKTKYNFSFISLDAQVKGKIIDEYVLENYPDVKVIISDLDGEGHYTVIEPPITDEDKETLQQIMEELYFSLEPVTEERGLDALSYIRKNVFLAAEKVGKGKQVQANPAKFLYYIDREMGYSAIHPLLNDPDVEEVECNGYTSPVTIVHRKYSDYPRLTTNVVFPREEELRRFVQRLAAKAGRSVNVALPIANFILPGGHRTGVTFGTEVSLPGTTFDIRLFPEEPISIISLLQRRMMPPLACAYIWTVAESKQFLLIVGATGTGKTTTLNSLLTLFNPASKILTVEDTAEIRLLNKNWVRFFTRESSYAGTKQISIEDLVKQSLRYRPDYVVVGEVRGAEIQYLVQAVASGHGGLTTFHSSSYQDVNTRITGLLDPGVAKLFQASISCVVVIRRLIDQNTGKTMRRIVAVEEPEPFSDRSHVVIKWDNETDSWILPKNGDGEEHWAGPEHYGPKLGSSFSPDGKDEQRQANFYKTVDAIIGSSQALKRAAEMLGWTTARLKSELIERTLLLTELAQKNVTDYRTIAYRLIQYYSTKE